MEFFSDLHTRLANDERVHDVISTHVKQMDAVTRVALAHLSAIHNHKHPPSDLLFESHQQLRLLTHTTHLPQLIASVPTGHFFRYHHLCARLLQNICYWSLLLIYLEQPRLVVSLDQLVQLTTLSIGLPSSSTSESSTTTTTTTIPFHIPIEDFLHGCISLINDLTRYAITGVIHEDYTRPLRISHFCQQLYAGFQLLDLKNDSLRKRFDGLKYDIKKLEEIVYNIKIRGLPSS